MEEGSRVALLGFGSIVQKCREASALLKTCDISVTVADARFCKPLDGDLIRSLAKEHEVLITVEEGSIGGFSSHVSHFLSLNGLLDGNLKVLFRHFYYKGLIVNGIFIIIRAKLHAFEQLFRTDY